MKFEGISISMQSVGLLQLLCLLVTVESVPIVTSITPGGVILSGGISVTVDGTALTDNTRPQVVITGTYNPDNSSPVTEKFIGVICTVITTTSLVCPSPQITLTKFTDAGYNVSTGGITRLINDTKLTFKIGVTFNGYVNWEQYQSVNLYRDPNVTMENPKREYTVWTNRIVNIYGVDLDKIVTNKTEYDISVSNLKCPVMYLNSTFMWCLLPTTTPIPNDVDNKHSLVVMKVGDFTKQLGRIWYRIPILSDRLDDPPEIFIPNDRTHSISINGTNLMVAITSGSVYRIQIGQGECTDIVLSATELKCRPPDLQPLPLDNYAKRENFSQIVITVPKIASQAKHQYTQHVGYVKYSDQIVTTSTTAPTGGNNNNNILGSNSWDTYWKWVLLGLAFLMSLIFLCCLVCCFCCCKDVRRNRKGWQKKKEDEQSYNTERNGSAHSSFRSYQSKTTTTYLDSDGSRFYYVTDEKMPASEYYGSSSRY